MTHADHDTLLRYRFDTLQPDQARELAEHLRRCADCSTRYAEVCRQVEALDAYAAEPEDAEAQLARALGAVSELRAAASSSSRQPQPPPLAAKATPYPGNLPAGATARTTNDGAPGDAGSAPEPDEPDDLPRMPLLAWMGIRAGGGGRPWRLAASVALLLAPAYVLVGGAIYQLRQVAMNTRVSAERRWLAGGEASAEVMVHTARTGEGVEGAEVSFALRCQDQRFELATGQTGPRGVSAPTFKVPDAARGDCELEVRSRALGERDTVSTPVAVERQIRVHVSTDKPLYQPGQTIHVRALALRHPSQAPAEGEALVFEVRDPKGNRLTREERTLGKFGVASLSFELASDVPLGAYAVSASAGGATESLEVKIDRYALPKLKVTVSPEKDAYLAGETLRATVRAQYFFGKPVAGARVRALFARATGDLLGKEVSGRTSADGELRIKTELPESLAAGGPESVLVEVQVTDPAGQEARHEHAVPVSRDALSVDVVVPGEALAQDMENDLFVIVTSPDGRPVAASVELSPRGSGQVQRAETGARGVAWLKVRPEGGISYDVTAEAGDGRRAVRTVQLPVRALPLALELDRVLYRPGETLVASVEVSGEPPGGELELVGIRDGQTVLRRRAAVRDGKATFEVPLPATFTGSLQLWAGMSPESPVLRVSRRIAVVEPHALSVTIVPDQPEYRPGGDARLRFEVKDAEGKPTPAVLGVAVVDESLFARAAEAPRQARAAFLLERAMLEPRRGISAADLLSSGGWTREEQAAAAALFSLVPAEGRPQALVQTTLPRKLAALEEEQRIFSLRAGFVGLAGGLALALVALAALLQNRLASPGRVFAAAMGVAGCWMAFGAPLAGAVGFLLLLLLTSGASESGRRRLRKALVGGVVAAFAVIALLVFSDLGDRLRMSFAASQGALAGGEGKSMTSFGSSDESSSGRKAVMPAPEVQLAAPAAPAPALPGVAIGKAQAVAEMDASLADRGEGGRGHGGPPAAAPPRRIVRVRQRFPETMFVHPEVVSDEHGVAELSLPVADSITSWRVSAFASSAAGRLGSAEAPLKVFQDFFVDVDVPPALVRGDEAEIPVAVHNYLPGPQTIRLEVQQEEWFELLGPRSLTFKVEPDGLDGRQLRIRALQPGKRKLTVRVDGTRLSDAVARELLVSERGQQVVDASSGELPSGTPARRLVVVPDQVASAVLALKLYPSRTSLALDGLEGSLGTPHGCFEQTSSTHYPNVLIYESLERSGRLTPELERRARGLISTGYQRLLTFEVPGGGFEWFGRAPANQVLTAYGLLELTDTARIFPVDPAVVSRTQAFLVHRQRPDGSWNPDAAYISDGLWRSELSGRVAVTAYVAWALAESGVRGAPLDRALGFLAGHLGQVNDAYTEALATAAFAKAGHGQMSVAARRLAARAARVEAGIRFAPAVATAYYGRGEAGVVETTALAEQALRGAAVEPELQQGAVAYLLSARDGRGTWRSTQATILALRALLHGGAQEGDLSVRVKVNGEDAGTFKVSALALEPTAIELPVKARRGQNVVEISGNRAVAYQLLTSYVLPWRQRGDEEKEPLSLKVDYGRTSLRVGDVLPLSVKVTYRRPEASGMVMVQLGLPPGLTPIPADLAALRSAGKVARFETGARALNLYLDALPPGGTAQLALRLKATGRVRTSGVESRAYLYYAPDVAADAPPIALAVN